MISDVSGAWRVFYKCWFLCFELGLILVWGFFEEGGKILFD